MAVQLAVSSLCKERLTSLKQVTTLCKKQELLYKPQFGTDLKCLRVPLFSFSHGTSQKSKHPSLLSFNMQLIPRGSDLKTLRLSLFLFLDFFLSFSIFIHFHILFVRAALSSGGRPRVEPKLLGDRCPSAKCSLKATETEVS